MKGGVLQVDIAIVGAGIVGLALANLLKDLPLNLALIEAHPIPEWDESQYGVRVSAISKASENLFYTAGVWDQIHAKRVSTYTDMKVWETSIGSNSTLHFSAAESGLANLGYIVENNLIRAELHQGLRTDAFRAKIHWCLPDKLTAVRKHEKYCEIALQSGLKLEASLLIGADGASSVTRRKLQLPSVTRSYEQQGVVAQLKLEQSHQQTAYQRFVGNDILAFLPLQSNDEVSMVWSVAENKAQYLQALDAADLERELAEAMQQEFGQIRLLSDVNTFPLKLLHSRQYVSERVVLCGDAAHAIHPLAGQGVNLGLLDVKVLSDVLQQAWEANYDLGDLSVLRRYERERKAGNVRVMSAMDALFTIFQSQQGALQSLRQFGMGLVNRVRPVKQELMQHALGLK